MTLPLALLVAAEGMAGGTSADVGYHTTPRVRHTPLQRAFNARQLIG